MKCTLPEELDQAVIINISLENVQAFTEIFYYATMPIKSKTDFSAQSTTTIIFNNQAQEE